MTIVKYFLYLLVAVFLFISAGVVILSGGFFSESLGPGEIQGKINTSEFVVNKTENYKNAAKSINANNEKQILFGDLHVHSTFSLDAHQMSLPIVGGVGVHPVADACDFARHCSALDFWSINDHAESLTPKRWKETKETIRKCNQLNIDKENPDCVAFLGWEWTQVGANRGTHWGHHNVILAEEEEALVPARPIASQSIARQVLGNAPDWPNVTYAFIDMKNFKRYLDFNNYVSEILDTPICERGVPSKELPIDCSEDALTPLVLANKVNEYDSDYIIIPHGQTWGLYTPKGYTLDKGLELSKQYPHQFDLLEIHSGHGNSEEYRSWRAGKVTRESEVVVDTMINVRDVTELDFQTGTLIATVDGKERSFDFGTQVCPEPSENYTPQCWKLGEIIYERCIKAGVNKNECDERKIKTQQIVVDRGRTGVNAISNLTERDKLDSGQCRDCFSPAMNYVPGGSAQYGMALTKFKDDGSKHRFKYGFISSSDNHQAAPGSGYKELFHTSVDGVGPPKELFDKFLHMEPYTIGAKNENPVKDAYISDDQPIDFDLTKLTLGFNTIEWERQRSFFQTGGLAAVHSEGRSKEEIWDAFKRHETYATSGPRILLWFDLVNNQDSKNGKLPMGSLVEMNQNPEFEVRAMGSYVQKSGCPEDAYTALGEDRVNELCYNECYNPSDERKKITRIEVIRVWPQEYINQPIDERIEDTWLVHNCDTDKLGCRFTFTDPDFSTMQSDVSYYARAIEEPSPIINVKGAHCIFDEEGNCSEFKICTQDFKNPRDLEACTSIDEPRAWSSPIYLNYKL